jgi:hypothetical protein
MARRRIQFSIASLMLATFACAVFVRFWPWRLAIVTQLILAVWAAFTLIQVPLLTWVWAGAPSDRERRRMLCYTIALPCCVLPIVNWLFVMVLIIAEQNKVNVPGDIVIVSFTVFLLVSSIVSLVVLPLTFVLFGGARRDGAFVALRLLAFLNLVAPLAVAVANVM